MRQATRITGTGLYPLLKLEALQYTRRQRTAQDLEANRHNDLVATFWERRDLEAKDWMDEPTFIRRHIMLKEVV